MDRTSRQIINKSTELEKHNRQNVHNRHRHKFLPNSRRKYILLKHTGNVLILLDHKMSLNKFRKPDHTKFLLQRQWEETRNH
jgi:hypothetical protein